MSCNDASSSFHATLRRLFPTYRKLAPVNDSRPPFVDWPDRSLTYDHWPPFEEVKKEVSHMSREPDLGGVIFQRLAGQLKNASHVGLSLSKVLLESRGHPWTSSRTWQSFDAYLRNLVFSRMNLSVVPTASHILTQGRSADRQLVAVHIRTGDCYQSSARLLSRIAVLPQHAEAGSGTIEYLTSTTGTRFLNVCLIERRTLLGRKDCPSSLPRIGHRL